MAIGERFRSGGARGIARFLSDHQNCDVGFDVRREAGPGTGLLSITCKGCGESITYKAAEAGELAAGPVVANEDAGVNAARPEPEPPPSAEEGFRRARRARRRSQGRGLFPMVLIGTLIVAGLVLIAIGVLRSGDDSESSGPTAITPPETSTPAEDAPPESQPAPDQQAPAVPLNRREFEGRFAIGVPAGWRASRGFSAIVLASPGEAAGIRIFLEPGAEPAGRLAAGAAGFLANDHSGAQIGKPQPVRLGQQKALSVTATYEGGEEVATVLSFGGYRFLILRRVNSDAPPEVAAAADAALQSFRAKG